MLPVGPVRELVRVVREFALRLDANTDSVPAVLEAQRLRAVEAVEAVGAELDGEDRRPSHDVRLSRAATEGSDA
jgi:hypothetical protein